MLRIRFYGVVFLLALFSASCGCNDDGDKDDDASIDDASSDVNGFDVALPEPQCPAKPPDMGTSCSGNVSCSYGPYESHWDCILRCPPECGGDIAYGEPAGPFYSDYRCENGIWISPISISDSSTFEWGCKRKPETDCPCWDSGKWDGSNGRLDSSTDDDSGTDDDAGN